MNKFAVQNRTYFFSKKNKVRKKYTVTSITYALCGLTLFGTLLLSIVTSLQVERFLHEQLRLRISDVVMMMAQRIDGDLHGQIHTIDDTKSEAFIKLKNDLWNMREHGTEIANAYAMRRKENGELVFIVDSSAKDQNAIGDVYPAEFTTETLVKAMNATPETLVNYYVEPEIYSDSWGTWLSAYAPIMTKDGKLDGIVGVDISADSIQKQKLECIFTIFLAAIVIFLITLPFLFRLMNFIRAMTLELEQSNHDFRVLLDNSGEGFLSFGRNLIIENQYSKACETMLGESPAGKEVTTVFFRDDKTKIDLFHSIIASVLEEKDEFVLENMLSLLPTEIQHEGRVLKAEYKLVQSQKFIVVLKDITQERHVTEMLNKERLQLQLIVVAVSDNRNFFDVVNAFRELLTQIPKMLNSTLAPHTIVKELYLEIHTLKGMLNQFSFPNTPKILHEIESDLSELRLLDDAETTTKKIATHISVKALQIAFDKDIAIITDKLGVNFMANGENIVLTYYQARKLEKLATQLLRGESIDVSVENIRNLLEEISKLRQVTFEDVLLGFDSLVQKTAERMEKEVAPLIVKGGSDIWIDPHAYQSFLRSLAHIFRNSVAHGIESPETRWELEKYEVGRITCYVDVVDNQIQLTILDDGAGINLNALRKKVVNNGLYTTEEVSKFSDDDVTEFIFMDNISTLDDVTDIAGRGVGLAAVKNEVKNMGGQIVVKTIAKKGTQFIFTLPLPEKF